jgi:hypothetical protein
MFVPFVARISAPSNGMSFVQCSNTRRSNYERGRHR